MKVRKCQVVAVKVENPVKTQKGEKAGDFVADLKFTGKKYQVGALDGSVLVTQGNFIINFWSAMLKDNCTQPIKMEMVFEDGENIGAVWELTNKHQGIDIGNILEKMVLFHAGLNCPVDKTEAEYEKQLQGFDKGKLNRKWAIRFLQTHEFYKNATVSLGITKYNGKGAYRGKGG